MLKKTGYAIGLGYINMKKLAIQLPPQVRSLLLTTMWDDYYTAILHIPLPMMSGKFVVWAPEIHATYPYWIDNATQHTWGGINYLDHPSVSTRDAFVEGNSNGPNQFNSWDIWPEDPLNLWYKGWVCDTSQCYMDANAIGSSPVFNHPSATRNNTSMGETTGWASDAWLPVGVYHKNCRT